MPLYEYECQNNHLTEAIYFNVTQRKAPSKVPCSKCDLFATRVLSPATAMFKGDGWDKRSTNERRVKL